MAEKYNKRGGSLFMGLYIALLVSVIVVMLSCSGGSVPRPRGYFRIEPYPATYRPDTVGGIVLQVNSAAQSTTVRSDADGSVWRNVTYPRYRATIYLSYIPVADASRLDTLMAESRELVYRQSVGAATVTADEYAHTGRRLYAILYQLTAQSATPLQFVATDSACYLVRGALYYDQPTQHPDSVAPTLQYLADEMAAMIESITPIDR